jgi:O-antigen/teichoic acid export membrane protein
MKTYKSDLFKKSSFIAFSAVISAVSRFLLVTILARYLNPESYGVWVSITSVAAIMMFGDFGITNALRNKLSILIADKDDTANIQREYFFTSFYYFLAFAIALSIVFVFFAKNFPIGNLYNTQNEILKKQGVDIFIYIQVTFFMSIPFGMANGLFFSYNESKYVAFFNIINSFITLGALLLLSMVFKANIVILAKIYFALNLLVNIFSLFFFIYKRKWYTNFSINVQYSFDKIKELLNTGIMFLGIQISTSFINNFPTVFLASVVDLKIAASFNITQKLYTMVMTVYQSIFNPIWSRLSLLAAQQNWNEFKALNHKIIYITFGVLVAFTIFFSFTAELIYRLVTGSLYEVSLPIVILLGISTTLYAMFEASSLLQNSLGKLKLRLISQLLVAATLSSIFSSAFNSFGVNSIPVVLSVIWLTLFVLLKYQGNKLINI